MYTIQKLSKITIWVLASSMLLLSLMVPGGPVETRSFQHVDPAVVMGFNIFLTLLVIVSLVTAYFMHKKQKWAYQLCGILGFAYMLVFILDLAKIFPVSSDPMEMPLLVLEWVSLFLGATLMGLSYKTVMLQDDTFWAGKARIPIWGFITVLLFLLVGLFIISFATTSALSS